MSGKIVKVHTGKADLVDQTTIVPVDNVFVKE